MLDHCSVSVNNYDNSMRFYDETLAILEYRRIVTINESEFRVAGYGNTNAIRPGFWISSIGQAEETVGNARGVHIAFVAPNQEAVDNWHKKCLELGGKDNGAPGPRTHYHSGYYGAFIIDPDGWRIEACIHSFQG